MGKHLRRILLSVLSLLAVTCCALFVACSDPNKGFNPGENPGGGEDKAYSVVIAEANGATVTADKTTAKKDDEVTLTVEYAYGYKTPVLTMNGEPLTVTDGQAKFTMPDSAANIGVTPVLADAKTTAATPETQLQFNVTIAGSTANSYWAATYGETALDVTVYVEDPRVTPERDGIELYFGLSGYTHTKLNADINRGVKVNAAGDAEYYNVNNGAYVKATEDNGVNVVKAEPWTKNGSKIDGYFVRVSVTYAALGLSEKPEVGIVTALPVLSNYTRALGVTKTYSDYERTNAGAYLLLGAEEWTENEFAGGTGILGGTSYLKAGPYWDLSKDYPSFDEDNYPNREVTLNAHDGNDNNLLFFRAQGESVYAEATIQATDIYGNEKLGKFGLMLFDGANKRGVFFFVDAHTGGKDASLNNIAGTSLGYTGTGTTDYTWKPGTIASTAGAFDLTTKTITLKMAYDGENEVLYMYYVKDNTDVLMARTAYTAKLEEVAIGFKSFAIGLKVTDYYATNDKTDPKFAAHIRSTEESAGALGDGGRGYLYGDGWDLSKDYAESDENYADREAVLKSHDGNDNNIYFTETIGKDAYVQATFKDVRMLNDTEAWGKFGLMLFDGGSEQSGLFYYVDSYVGNDGINKETNKTDKVIRGKNLGYNDAIGGWGGWNGVPGGENKFDLTTKTITLGMAYCDDVVSLWLIEGQEATLMMQYVHTPNGNAVLGIKSFAVGVTLTDYYVNTDETSEEFIARTPEIVRQDLDTLFAGDSYMDFWKLYGLWDTLTCDMTVKEGETTRAAKLANRGIGGTQVPLWSSAGMLKTLSLSYNPKQIAFHIGVNDIDSPATPDVVYARLQDMFTKYHTTFPNAQIFWVSLIPNNFYINNGGTYNDNYKTLNAKVKTLAQGLDYVTYIDMETPFTDESGNARTNLFMNDGLHLNPVYGYPLWTSIIKNALGYISVADGTLGDLGDMTTDGYSRKATLGWTHGGNDYIAEIKNDVVFGKTVNTEEVTYFDGVHSADILFEADLRSPDRFYPDNNSKPGVALVNDDITIFAYLQTLNDEWQNNGRTVQWYGILYRNNKTNSSGKPTGVADWNWSTIGQFDKQIDAINICADFHKLGIAKIGTTIYLLLDGNVVREYQNFPGITDDMKFSGAVMTFNRYMQVKSARAITDVEAIRTELIPSYNISALEYEGATITIDGNKTRAKVGETVSFSVVVADLDKVYITYGGQDHELTLDNGKYSFIMPGENVTIKLEMLGRYEVKLHADIADKVVASSVSVAAGSTVTFTAKDGWYIKKLFVGQTEITKQDGVFTYTVTGEFTVTGEVYEYVRGMIFDGELTADEGWTQEILGTGAYFSANGLPLTLYGFNSADGVRIAAVIDHNTPVTERLQGQDTEKTADAWHLYLGLEIRLNNKDGENGKYNIQTTTWGGGHRYAVGCTPNWTTFTNATGSAYKYTSVCELIVNHSLCDTNADTPVPIALGGVFQHGFQWLGGYNDNVLRFTHTIGKNGLTTVSDEHKKLYEAQMSATLDGEFSETVWTDEVKSNTFSQIVNGAKVSVMGVKDTNGVLIGVTVDHYTAPDARCQQANNVNDNFWYFYMGPEFRLNNKDIQVASSTLGQAIRSKVGIKSVKYENENKWTTKFEMFVPYSLLDSDGSADIPLAMGGVYESGFQCLFASSWNGETHVVNSTLSVTAKGLKRVSPNLEGVALNGILDDSVWTESILSAGNTLEYNVTSGKVAINAVKLTNGVLLAVRVTSTQSAFVPNGVDNRLAWESYQNVRVNLFAVAHHVYAFAPSIDGIANAGSAESNASFGAHEVKNTDNTYTTTYEIYIPKTAYADQDFSGNIALTCIVHTTQADVGTFNVLGETEQSGANVNWFGVCGYITDNGMIGLSA